MKKNIKMILILLFIISVVGISYAFFNYTRIGNENELVVGKIYLHYNTSRNLPLVNVEPRNTLDSNMYIEFTIDGLNEYKEKDIWYGIDLLYGDIPNDKTSSNRIRDDLLRFTLMKKVDNGEFETIIDDKGYPSIDELRMYVETIPKETNSELSHTYRLYMWISDTIRVGNAGNPNIDYTMEEWNNLFASIKIRVLGDFVEKTNDDGIKVVFDANGGSVNIPVKYYNVGDTYGSLPIPVRENYAFDGWELDNNKVQTTDVVNNANVFYSVSQIEQETRTADMYRYIGAKKFNGTSDYINTGIYLFSQANYQRNFYVSFEIKSNDANQVAQAILMGSNDEEKSANPGMFFRINNNSYQLATRSPNGDVRNISFDTEKVEILRINKIVYYRLNGTGTFNVIKDMSSFTNYHDIPVSFGSGIKSNAIFRPFKGTLSNMIAEFISDDVTLDNYEEYIHNNFDNPGNYFNNVVTLKAKWIIDKMNTFPAFISDKKAEIKRIVFKKENETDLARYNAITDNNLKGDIGTEGSVKAWLEQDNNDNLYTLYVESETLTYLITGKDLFRDFANVREIDLGNVDTSGVTSMSSMFSGCQNLTNLNLSNFNTSSVTNMGHMFYNCSSLTNLDVSKFNTSSVQYVDSMFYGCQNLTSLNLSNFNTSNVTNMGHLFDGCQSLTSLDISNFNTISVTNMDSLFNGCQSLTSLDVSKFDTSNVTDMRHLFNGCKNLTNLDVSKFNTSAVTNMIYMFCNCRSLTSLDVSKFDTINVTDMKHMFNNCSGLTSLDVSKFNTSSVTDMSYMFNSCSGLTSLDVSKFNTSLVTNMSYMFNSCNNLTSLDVSKFNTASVTDMSYMFYYCRILISVDVSKFNTSAVTNMAGMFSGCRDLSVLDLSSFNTSNVTDIQKMFYNCRLTRIYVSNLWNLGAATQSVDMFEGCSTLVGQAPNTTYAYDGPADKTYAVIATDNQKGYLTDISLKPGD